MSKREQRLSKYQELIIELEEWRMFKGIQKKKLARMLGLRTPVTLFYWRKGITIPYPRTAFRIMQLLGKKMTVKEFKEWTK